MKILFLNDVLSFPQWSFSFPGRSRGENISRNSIEAPVDPERSRSIARKKRDTPIKRDTCASLHEKSLGRRESERQTAGSKRHVRVGGGRGVENKIK